MPPPQADTPQANSVAGTKKEDDVYSTNFKKELAINERTAFIHYLQ